MIIEFTGQVPAQKNKKRAGVNRQGKPFMYTEKVVKDWHANVHKELVKQWNGKEPLKQATIFYDLRVKDRRRRDADNMIASINDALVLAGILEDDSLACLKSTGWDGRVEKDEPGATIELIEDEWDNGY